MHKWVVPVLLIVGVLSFPTALHAQSEDPAGVVQASTKLFNSGDHEGSLGYWADDAVVKLIGVPPGQPDTFNGKEQIRAWYKSLAEIHFQIQEDLIKADGDTLTFKAVSSSDQLRQLGVASLTATEVYVVKNGKIASLTWTISPESAAKLQAAIAASAPQTTAKTGGEPFSTYILALLLGGLAILAGLALTLRARGA